MKKNHPRAVVLNLFVSQTRWVLSSLSMGWIWPVGPIWCRVGLAGPDPAAQKGAENTLALIQLSGRRGPCLAPTQPCRGKRAWPGVPTQPCEAWEYGSRRGMAILIASAPLPPNFLMLGKPHGLDAKTL